MLFLFIRILPFALPLIFFAAMKLLFVFPAAWYYVLASIIVFNLIYFYLLNLKTKNQQAWLFLAYSVIYGGTGLLFSILIDAGQFINIFLIFWTIFYALYLEGVFNYLYKTQKVFLLDLKNITAYLNLIIFFFLVASLFYLFVYLDWTWYWLVLIFAIITPILVSNILVASNFMVDLLRLYSVVISYILIILFVALLYWPVSFYVTAAMIAIAYYLLTAFSLINSQNKLNSKTIIKYLSFATASLILILVTAKWI